MQKCDLLKRNKELQEDQDIGCHTEKSSTQLVAAVHKNTSPTFETK